MPYMQDITIKQPTTAEITEKNRILIKSIEVKYNRDRKQSGSIKVKTENDKLDELTRYKEGKSIRWKYDKHFETPAKFFIMIQEHIRPWKNDRSVEVEITDDMIVKPIIVLSDVHGKELSVNIHCEVAGPFIEWIRHLVEESQNKEKSMEDFMKNLGKACEVLNYIVSAMELASGAHPAVDAAVSVVRELYEKCKGITECYQEASSLMADVASFLPFVKVPRSRSRSNLSNETACKILELFEKIAKGTIKYFDNTKRGMFMENDDQIDAFKADREELRKLKETFDWCIKTEVWEAVLKIENHTETLVLDKLRPVMPAFYDRAKACFEGTRKETLQMIEDWSTSNSKLFWLHGSAGTGKTTITHSVAQRFREQKRLAGCFFCDKNNVNEELRDPKRIMPTIAYQFAKWHADYRSIIVHMLEGEGELDLHVGLGRQIDLLMEGPIAKSPVQLSPGHRPLVIVLDALDECCEDAKSRRDLAEFIRDIANVLPCLKVFVSSATSTEFKACFLQDDTRHLDIGDPSLDLRDDVATYIQYSIEHRQVSSQARWEQARKTSGLLSRFHWAFQIPGSDSRAQSDVSEDQYSARALGCLDLMKTRLKFNTCGLGSAYLKNVDIEGLTSKVERNIPDILRYSSLSWMDHILQSHKAESFHSSVKEFLCSEKVLFWIEVMGLLGTLEKGKEILLQCAGHFKEVDEIARAATELHGFISTFHDAIAVSTSHLYLSALTWAPPDSTIVRHASAAFVGWKSPLPDGPPQHVPPASSSENNLLKKADISFLKRDTSNIRRAKYTPDGSKIVSSTYDDIVQIWDAKSGEAISTPFKCHVPPIRAIAYSRDGSRIASGSDDGKLRIWDAHTGELLIESQEGHKYGIGTLAYSPDGTRIVTGSRDDTLRIWDAQSGACVGEPLTGHTDYVTAVAYAPDGHRIVSGSFDGTLRIWDAQSGAPFGEPLSGHKGGIWAVAYAPDGSRIVSGSRDNTLRIWDAQSGESIGAPLEGHSGQVTSVAYSPDGTKIVSGSYDRTLRIWDARSDRPIGEPLEGHDNAVYAVAYSPDGSRIVSASYDDTLRIWDAHAGEPIGTPLSGHESWVVSVAYSPDGNGIASGSYDGTIRIWDAHNGACIRMMSLGESRWDPDAQCFLTVTSCKHVVEPVLTITHTANPSTIPDDGWLRTLDGGLFLWVPPEHRRSICHTGQVRIPNNKDGKVMYMDWTKIPHGKDWAKIMSVKGSDKD